MSRAAWSMFVFGSYLVVAGGLLVLAPGEIYSLIGLRLPGDGIWARLSGMLILNLAYFCFAAARGEGKNFMRWSVVTRSANLPCIWAFVAYRLENPIFLVFGLLDLLGALWTLLALYWPNTAPAQAGRIAAGVNPKLEV